MAKIEDLIGKTLTEITVINDDVITFKTSCGETYKMYHDQDCCEYVAIEDICGDLEDLKNSPILKAEERVNQNTETFDDEEEWTFYELATLKGSVTIRWYGTSNGYYSVSVSFIKE